jgi:hypothetical protein
MEDQTKAVKNWVKIYPIYIDKNFKNAFTGKIVAEVVEVS